MKQLVTSFMTALLVAGLAMGASAQSLTSQKKSATLGSARTVSPQAVGDAYKVIYRVSGVSDGGGSPEHTAVTAFFCSNYSASREKIYFLIREFNGDIRASVEWTMNARATVTAATRAVGSIISDFFLLAADQSVNGGSAVIMSTTLNLHCSVLVMDRVPQAMNGAALHMVRFNPHPGSVE